MPTFKPGKKSAADRRADSVIYTVRADTLKAMGFSNYGHYLSGDLWKSIRSTVLQGSPECRGNGCGRPAACVHHRSYSPDVLAGTDLTPLVPLCMGCHARIELKKGVKVSVAEADRRLIWLLENPKRFCALSRRRKSKKKSCGVCGTGVGCTNFELTEPRHPRAGEKRCRKLCAKCRAVAEVVSQTLKIARTYNGAWGALKIAVKAGLGTTGKNLFAV